MSQYGNNYLLKLCAKDCISSQQAVKLGLELKSRKLVELRFDGKQGDCTSSTVRYFQ